MTKKIHFNLSWRVELQSYQDVGLNYLGKGSPSFSVAQNKVLLDGHSSKGIQGHICSSYLEELEGVVGRPSNKDLFFSLAGQTELNEIKVFFLP